MRLGLGWLTAVFLGLTLSAWALPAWAQPGNRLLARDNLSQVSAHAWTIKGSPAAYLASVAAVCGLLVIYGPQMRAAAETHEVQVIEQEDRAFCSKFGMVPETARYAECAAGLKEIRARHLERYLERSNSIL